MNELIADHWQSIARHTPLLVLTDLDGTLIPFAPTPEDAVIDPELTDLVRTLAGLPGVQVVVVSGRPQATLDRYFPDRPTWLVAEHGAWFRGDGAWHPSIDLDASPVQTLADRLERMILRYPGASIERKTWSCAVHHRLVSEPRRAELEVEVTGAIDAFVAENQSFERVDGHRVIEIRAAGARKSFAVNWARRQIDSARIIALGDDVTDEHLFRELGPRDEPVLVQGGVPRQSCARWRVDGVAEARALLRYVVSARTGEATLPAITPLRPAERPPNTDGSLLVVSNRLPDLRPIDGERPTNVGGLVSALAPSLAERRGVWLGWSGNVVPDTVEPDHGSDDSGTPSLAWFDYKQRWMSSYYNGFCNATLWPLFHSFPGRVTIDESTWRSYVEVHDVFADAAVRNAKPDDTIWVHDYQLLLLARAMRARGHRGRIGLFLHVPFPSLDILELLPWAGELIEAMLDFDLVGFHTPGYVRNFITCAGSLAGSRSAPTLVEHRGHFTRVEAFPIGISPESFQESPDASLAQEIEELSRSLGTAELVLGVDRLDYTKGIPQRLLAFGRFLELYPEWRGKVSLIQISVPSRADVPEYAEQRAQVEAVVGRINGEFGEAHWVPIRYLYRGYSHAHLGQLYRKAAVGYVTPLRDGMNLVAKEYVAAQDAEDPGVLVLSRFAGAAVEMKDAVLTNPYFTDGMARDLDHALRMPLEERRTRHARLSAVVERTTAHAWAQTFLHALSEVPSAAEQRESSPDGVHVTGEHTRPSATRLRPAC